MKKILVILGPTALGKTDLALKLAKKWGGELVSCDSRQVYTGLDIGTGKLPSLVDNGDLKIEKGEGYWVLDGVKIWMYDCSDPRKQYSVKDYIRDGERAIDKISKQGKLPIIVGGSGFYLKGLLFGIDNLGVPVDKGLREKLSRFTVEELQNSLQEVSPTLFDSLNNSDKLNSRRLIRKIELVSMNPYINTKTTASGIASRFNVLSIGLLAPRPALNSFIDHRLDFRFKSGLVLEARSLTGEGVTIVRMRELGLEYGVLADLLEGVINERECLEKLKLVNYHYAKRQMTFFKRMENINWFDVTAENYLMEIGKLVEAWYNG